MYFDRKKAIEEYVKLEAEKASVNQAEEFVTTLHDWRKNIKRKYAWH